MKAQIWIAVSVYVLVAIVKKRLNLDALLYTLLQILSVTLFEKIAIRHAVYRNRIQLQRRRSVQPTESICVLTGH